MADNLAGSSVEENKPIRDIAYETLKHAIIIGDIPAGTRIIETHYADKLHISRTPLREAMRQLELDGLVEYKERKGVIVSAFTIDDIEEIFTIRNALMMLIMPSVIENVTEEDIAALNAILDKMDISQRNEDADALAQHNREFHRRVEHIARKVRILRVIDSQEEYIQRFAALSIASIVRRSHAHQEHHQMIDFLTARDLEGLSRLMRHHLDESKETCLNAVRSGKRLPKKS